MPSITWNNLHGIGVPAGTRGRGRGLGHTRNDYGSCPWAAPRCNWTSGQLRVSGWNPFLSKDPASHRSSSAAASHPSHCPARAQKPSSRS